MAEWSIAQVCKTSVHGFESRWCLHYITLYPYTMLSFIPTPIGNIEDITLRAQRLFKELSIFFCEDTRTTKKLLRMYEIEYTHKQFFSLTSFTSDAQLMHYVNLATDNHCGVVSDAWVPWLSDPWKALIEVAHRYWIPFEVLPWANALLPVVVASPRDSSSFTYVWFPPTKKGRQTFFTTILQSVYPVYMYESVHRIEKTIKQMLEMWGDRQCIIGRELTKMYEQLHVWTLQSTLKALDDGTIPKKGEFVVWVYPDEATRKWK